LHLSDVVTCAAMLLACSHLTAHTRAEDHLAVRALSAASPLSLIFWSLPTSRTP